MRWTNLELLVTTICNRSCPNCCYRIPKHETLAAVHYEWPVFERAADTFRGVGALYVSGGEPTLHPEFPRIARYFRELFSSEKMILVTNGHKLVQHQKSVGYFDHVWITQFPDKNTAEATMWLRANCSEKIMAASDVHLAIDKPGGGRPCSRYGFPACAGDRVWPCCVGPGIAGAPSAPVDNCSDVFGLGAPCASCAFSL